MIVKIQKWGNSQGVRLSKAMLSTAGLEVGEEVGITVEDGTLIVTPVRRVRGGTDLRELVSRLPKGSRAWEVDWGGSVGREVW